MKESTSASYLLHYTYASPEIYFFFFNDTATTEIYTLSLHDALPISLTFHCAPKAGDPAVVIRSSTCAGGIDGGIDRKSTRLNSSHSQISYAVFCLKKKKVFQL